MITRPENPYRKGTLIWSVMEGGLQGEFDGLPGWEDLTPMQIAEVLGCKTNTVQRHIARIKRETGYIVPHMDGRQARWGV